MRALQISCSTTNKRRTFRSDGMNHSTNKLTRVEPLIEETRNYGYQERHRESLTYSRNKLLRPEIAKKKIRNQGRGDRGQRKQSAPKRELGKKLEAVKLRRVSVGKSACPLYLRSGV